MRWRAEVVVRVVECVVRVGGGWARSAENAQGDGARLHGSGSWDFVGLRKMIALRRSDDTTMDTWPAEAEQGACLLKLDS